MERLSLGGDARGRQVGADPIEVECQTHHNSFV